MLVNLNNKVTVTKSNSVKVNPSNTQYKVAPNKNVIINIKGTMYKVLKQNGIKPNTKTNPLGGVKLTPTQNQNLINFVRTHVQGTKIQSNYVQHQPKPKQFTQWVTNQMVNYVNKKVTIKS